MLYIIQYAAKINRLAVVVIVVVVIVVVVVIRILCSIMLQFIVLANLDNVCH